MEDERMEQRLEYLWKKACDFEGEATNSRYIRFSPENRYGRAYYKLYREAQAAGVA